MPARDQSQAKSREGLRVASGAMRNKGDFHAVPDVENAAVWGCIGSDAANFRRAAVVLRFAWACAFKRLLRQPKKARPGRTLIGDFRQ
jgi:hypothetical protein